MAFHRRTKLGAKDNGALSIVMIGSGCNAEGFYTFHGGCNPIGKTGYLNESLTTGVNSNSVISNDFQGAIGEFGQIRDSYYEYPVQLNFQADFGKYLAPCRTFVPVNIDPETGGDIYNTKLLQNAIRTDGHKGFIFMNNYFMHDTMNVFNDVQFKIKLKDETLLVPEKPFNISKGQYFIWPFNLNLSGVNLKYATAQPFAFLKKNNTYCFFKNDGINAEFVIDNSNVKSIIGDNVEITKESDKIIVKAKSLDLEMKLKTNFVVKLKSGKEYRFLVLSEQDAKHSYKNNDKLYVTRGLEVLLFDGEKIKAISSNVEGTVSVYPTEETSVLFSTQKIEFKDFPVVFNYKKIQDGTDLKYPLEKARSGDKVGPPEDKYFDNGSIYSLNFPEGISSELYDVRLNVDYKASCLRYYVDGRFVYDNYYNGTPWVFSARHLMDKTEAHYKAGSKLELKVLPLQPNDMIFIDDTYWPDLNLEHNVLEMNDIKLEKVYSKIL